MKLGLVSAILDGWDLEPMLAEAKAAGYSCVEVACWPAGKAERRYAGVSHIDVTNTSPEYIAQVKALFEKYGMGITSLAFYPNPLDPEQGPAAVEHLYHVIEMSALLGVNMVTTYKWEYGEPLYVRVMQDGGLPAGTHKVKLTVATRTAYIPIPLEGIKEREVTIA